MTKLAFAVTLAVLAQQGLAQQSPAHASDWPERPIRAIVPFTAGSAVDTIPRVIFEQLSRDLHQPIIVENRAGAGGTIGAAVVARAEPNGYTILVNTSSHTIIPSLYPAVPYDTARDFAAVIPLGSLPTVLVVAPSKGFKTIQELVSAAKARPGSITYASAGVGSATHFAAERLRMSAGINAIHVPFRGAPEAYTEVMSGRVDFCFGAISSALPLIKDGKLLPLAVSTAQRASALPDVPTTLEAGFRDSDYTFWVGMFAPEKTPSDIVKLLHQQTLNTLQATAMREKLAALGVDPMVMTPSEFDDLVKAEIAKNALVVRAAGIKAE